MRKLISMIDNAVMGRCGRCKSAWCNAWAICQRCGGAWKLESNTKEAKTGGR